MEPAPHALEGEILTTGPPGVSHVFCFKIRISESKNCYQWKQRDSYVKKMTKSNNKAKLWEVQLKKQKVACLNPNSCTIATSWKIPFSFLGSTFR